jgi:hypothetical protein
LKEGEKSCVFEPIIIIIHANVLNVASSSSLCIGIDEKKKQKVKTSSLIGELEVTTAMRNNMYQYWQTKEQFNA